MGMAAVNVSSGVNESCQKRTLHESPEVFSLVWYIALWLSGMFALLSRAYLGTTF
jgi:hypothetical protein